MAERFRSASCEGERCSVCGKPADAKVGEEIMHDDPHPNRHNLTAYVCFEHFDRLFNRGTRRPSDLRTVMSKLDDLYSITGHDWELTVSHCLTEPTCPTVIIAPEEMSPARYRIDCDSIEEGIAEAVERVYREVVLGEFVEPMAPYTNNPDDAELETMLREWKAKRNAG